MRLMNYFFGLTLLLTFSCANEKASNEAPKQSEEINKEEQKAKEDNPSTPTDSSTSKVVELVQDSIEVKAQLEFFTSSNQTYLGDLSCSCSFSTKEQEYKSYLFLSNYEDKASIQVNGEAVHLSGAIQDTRTEYSKKAAMKNWLVLKERGKTLVFGQPYDFSGDWYEGIKLELKKALSTMDQLPKEIPVEKIGTVGMGFRGDINDLCKEAIAEVQSESQKGMSSIPFKALYSNSEYNCIIEAQKVGQDDGGGPQYQGKMELKTKDGKLLDSKKIVGGCGC